MPLARPHILQVSPDTQDADRAAPRHGRVSCQAHVLVITSNPPLCELCHVAFADERFICTIPPDAATAQVLSTDETGMDRPYDILVGEVRSHTIETSLSLEVFRRWTTPPAIIVIGPSSIDSVLVALRLGISDYLTTPVEPEQLRDSALRVLAQRQRIRQ